MKRSHRRAHVLIWVLLLPALAAFIWQALADKQEVSDEPGFPLVKKEETFQ